MMRTPRASRQGPGLSRIEKAMTRNALGLPESASKTDALLVLISQALVEAGKLARDLEAIKRGLEKLE